MHKTRKDAKIKICGLSRKEDIEAVNLVFPDYVGFVFAKSSRQVNVELAKELKAILDPRIKTVGVFVNEEIPKILSICKSGIIDYIQLHGDETNEYRRELKAFIPNKIIKAVRVKQPEDFTKDYNYCDYLLFDTYHKNQYGGTGSTFDWSMITCVSKPFFIAGGINKDNIIYAMKQGSPYGIDVSSGVETMGYKDKTKIIEIVSILRDYKEEKDVSK